MNTQVASQGCEKFWTPIVAWPGASTGFYGSAQLFTDVEFLGLVVNQHKADMAELANAFVCCIDELFSVEPAPAA